jgi:hypothetical protein
MWLMKGLYIDISLCICDELLKILLRLLCSATTTFGGSRFSVIVILSFPLRGRSP